MRLPHCETLAQTQKCLDELIIETPAGAWTSVVRAVETPESALVVGLCGIAVLTKSETGEICIWSGTTDGGKESRSLPRANC